MDTNPDKEVAPLDDLLQSLGSDEPEEQTEDQTDEPEAEESTEEPEEGKPEEEAEELEEVEIDGEQFKLPKKVQEAVLRQQDYTKKTQALAELRRSVEDRDQYLQAVEQMRSEGFKEAAEVHALQTQLEQYSKLDWNSLIAEDQQQALKLNFARQQLQQSLTEKQQKLQSVASRIQEATKKHEQEQRSLSQTELQRRLGKLSDQDRSRIMSAAQELGFEERDMWNPRALHALHLAAKYMELQKPKALKKVTEAPKVMKPQAPQSRQRGDLEAEKRLKKHGRVEDLAKLL